MNLWIPHQQKKRQAYHSTLLPHHGARLDLIAGKLHYRFASITAMFFPLTIVSCKG